MKINKMINDCADITECFDPTFLAVLQSKNYIPEVKHVTFGDVKNIDTLNIEEEFITSLTGIEYFESLTKLNCANCRLDSLDVSKNTELSYLYCKQNRIVSLDVSKNTKLSYLECGFNDIVSLNVSKNVKLTYLNCEVNDIISLDISKNTELIELNCSHNPGNGSLLCVKAWFDNNNIPENCTTGHWTWGADSMGNNGLDISIDYQKNENKSAIDRSELCESTDITADFDPKFAAILKKRGYISDTTHITFADVRDIHDLDIHSAMYEFLKQDILTSLAGIEYFESLQKLDCSLHAAIQFLDVSKNTELTHLNCSYNRLNFLSVAANTKLIELNCSSNQIRRINFAKCLNLEHLDCGHNHLHLLHTDENVNLIYLDCSNNYLDSLDTAHNKKLYQLNCRNNHLEYLNVSKNVDLVELEFDGNSGRCYTFPVIIANDKIFKYKDRLTKMISSWDSGYGDNGTIDTDFKKGW